MDNREIYELVAKTLGEPSNPLGGSLLPADYAAAYNEAKLNVQRNYLVATVRPLATTGTVVYAVPTGFAYISDVLNANWQSLRDDLEQDKVQTLRILGGKLKFGFTPGEGTYNVVGQDYITIDDDAVPEPVISSYIIAKMRAVLSYRYATTDLGGTTVSEAVESQSISGVRPAKDWRYILETARGEAAYLERYLFVHRAPNSIRVA